MGGLQQVQLVCEQVLKAAAVENSQPFLPAA